MKMNILIVGVGGQGSLLASRILGRLFLSRGLDVKVSEVHGMSQRGGSVVTYIRAGKEVASPLVPEGEADLIIAFEKLEALRWFRSLKKGGNIIMNLREIDPMPVITGAAEYPKDIAERLQKKGESVTAIDALTAAKAAGSIKTENMVMLGAASKVMDFSDHDWQEAISQSVKPEFLEMNLRAFSLGKTLNNKE